MSACCEAPDPIIAPDGRMWCRHHKGYIDNPPPAKVTGAPTTHHRSHKGNVMVTVPRSSINAQPKSEANALYRVGYNSSGDITLVAIRKALAVEIARQLKGRNTAMAQAMRTDDRTLSGAFLELAGQSRAALASLRLIARELRPDVHR